MTKKEQFIPNNKGRELPATKVDIFTRIELLGRAYRGESSVELAKEYGVSQNTIWRWMRSYKQGYERLNHAGAFGYTHKDLETLLEQIGVLRANVTRMEAILTRIIKPKARYKNGKPVFKPVTGP